MAQAQNPAPSTTGQGDQPTHPAASPGQTPQVAPANPQYTGNRGAPGSGGMINPQSGTDANGQPMYSVNTGVYNNPYMQQEQSGITWVTNQINGQHAAQAATPGQAGTTNASAAHVNSQGFDAQAQNLKLLQQQAAGGGPAAQAVQMQSQNTMNQGINAAMALAGSQRGGNAGEALRQGEIGQAQVTGQAANQAAMNTLQSEQQGITNAGSVAGAMQGESLQDAQLRQQNNQFNAGAANTSALQNQQLGEQTALANQGATNTMQQFQDTSDVGLLNNSIALDQNQYGNNIQGAQYATGSANDVTQANQGHQISQQNANTGAAATAIQGVQAGANIAQGVGTAVSDRNAKKGIEPGDPDVAAFLDSLKAQTWDYKDPEKHGEGRRLGPMAQDLQKSELGDHMVSPDNEGTLRVDYGKGMAAMVASLAYLNDKIKKLEASK